MPDETSFLAALREKYCEDDEQVASSSDGFVSITVFGGNSRRGRQRELVGAGGADDGRGAGEGQPRRPELAHLKHVVLENKGISHAAIPSTGLSSLCPNVLELDLSGNSLTGWTEVLTILRHLPLLRFVNLSSNPLQNLEIDNNETIPCNIRDLVLNDTKVTWREVAALSRLMPQLEQLHLCKNDYSEISLTAEDLCASLPCVRILTLNNNYIKRWDEVSKLRLLPRLKTLVLLENPLEDVYYKQTNPSSPRTITNQTAAGEEVTPSASAKGPGIDGEQAALETEDETGPPSFAALESLCLTSTALSDWANLQELSRFPALTSVKLKSIPLLENWEEKERRKVAVACLPHVKKLNGSEITVTEREKAERHFVRLFHDQADPPARHSELVQTHGELEPLVQVDINQGFQEFAQLTFIYRGRCVQQEVIRMTNPISELRKHCAKLVEKEPCSVKLFLRTQDPDTQELQMEELFLDSLPMSRFDIGEGSEIHIDVDEKAENFWWKSAVKMAP